MPPLILVGRTGVLDRNGALDLPQWQGVDAASHQRARRAYSWDYGRWCAGRGSAGRAHHLLLQRHHATAAAAAAIAAARSWSGPWSGPWSGTAAIAAAWAAPASQLPAGAKPASNVPRWRGMPKLCQAALPLPVS